jgi:hypothetical protein
LLKPTYTGSIIIIIITITFFTILGIIFAAGTGSSSGTGSCSNFGALSEKIYKSDKRGGIIGQTSRLE